MTPTEQAARWLADVKRYDLEQPDSHMGSASMALQPGYGDYIEYADALAAIARHLAPQGDDLVAKAAAALQGVTGGPWRVDGQPWNQIVWSGAENRVCFMAHSNGLDDDRDIATARFIAFARQWVPEAAARLSALTSERDEALAAADDAAEYARNSDAEVATLRDRLARMEGAAKRVLDAPFDTMEEHDAVTDLRAALAKLGVR